MGKPSSSSKKKLSKNSSQSQTRKRKKVKSRRSKSRKLHRRRDGSDSYSGDSDSRSLVSDSSYSSEDDYRSRRSRSRNRKDAKGGKKRARRRSSSRESSESSPRVKKRRRSRRGDDYEKRKRSTKKKRSRRDRSVSSMSSWSRSCSTSRSGSSSGSDEIGYERARVRPERVEKSRRRSETVKTGSKRSRDRSRSSSSCSRYNEGGDHPFEERVMEETNSRRLKSVITVVRQESDSGRVLNANEPKEDVYDYDDYPSCRSNDSNDGCSRRELPEQSHLVSEMKRPQDDGQQGEFSNIITTSVEESGKDGKPRFDGVGENDALKENNKISSASCGVNGEDMELILRQRALENLRKFRGGIQAKLKPPITQNDKCDGDVKAPSSENTAQFQIKTPKGDDIRVVIESQDGQLTRQPPVRRDSSALPKNTGILGSGVASAPAQVFPDGVPRLEANTAINTVSNKSKLVTSRTRQESPNSCTIKKQEPVAQVPSQAKLVAKSRVNEGDLEIAQTENSPNNNAAVNTVSNRPKSVKLQVRQESPITNTTQKLESAVLEPSQATLVTSTSVNKNGLETAQTVKPPECCNNGGEVNNNRNSACDKPASSSISTSGDMSSDKQEDETKDSSQFQQKTMSVMRGGEMVQVSYQVYIPKRAPALARRQLKR